jgi:hypothetical protein
MVGYCSKMDARKTCVTRDWTTYSKYDNHHRLNSVNIMKEKGGYMNIYKHKNLHFDNE